MVLLVSASCPPPALWFGLGFSGCYQEVTAVFKKEPPAVAGLS